MNRTRRESVLLVAGGSTPGAKSVYEKLMLWVTRRLLISSMETGSVVFGPVVEPQGVIP